MKNIIILLLACLAFSCEKECVIICEVEPNVHTKKVTNVSTDSVTLNGKVTAYKDGKDIEWLGVGTGVIHSPGVSYGAYIGGRYYSGRGFCWSTEPNPEISPNYSNNEYGVGEFSERIKISKETLYIRAFVITNKGIYYGNEICYQKL